MDAAIMQILESLEPFKVGEKTDISTVLNEIFPLTLNLQQYEKFKEDGNISRFFEVLKNYLYFEDTLVSQPPYTNGDPPVRFVNFPASTKEAAKIALKQERDRVIQSQANQSSIDLTASIMATNTAIRATDARMLERAETQEAIMRTQSSFMERQATFAGEQVEIMGDQKKLIQTQNNLYKFTLGLTVANIAVASVLTIATINSNADKQSLSTAQSQLVAKEKEIKRLQLLKSDTVHYVLHYPVPKNKPKSK